jgi:hypothetical protein
MIFGLETDSDWDMRGGDREALAASNAIHLVKTHQFPPATPLAGERAIQMIRHPAAATASQYRLFKATKPRERPLKRFIVGHIQSGLNWSSLYECWHETAMPFICFRYEDAYVAPFPIVAHIADFLGLPQPERPVAERPEEASARNPIRNPAAGPDGWRDVIDTRNHDRLIHAHAVTARRFGYVLD